MPDPSLSSDRLVWMYSQMLRIREFEERVKRTFEEHEGTIRGHTHLADGAEASIVGTLAALRPEDHVLATYRCHGYPLVLGTDPNAMMAEIYGRSTGLDILKKLICPRVSEPERIVPQAIRSTKLSSETSPIAMQFAEANVGPGGLTPW